MSHTIRTTLRPDVEITVTDREYLDLLEQGLVYDGTPPNPVADPFDQRVADHLADADSATRAAMGVLYGDASDPAIAGLVADSDSATRAALGAAFVSRSRSAMDAARALRDRAYRTWDAQVADPTVTPRMVILGHSVVVGSGASDQPHTFGRKLTDHVQSQRPGTVVTIDGHAGFNTTELLPALPGAFATQPAGSVGCLLLMAMINDYSEGVDPATTQANLTQIISTLRAHASAAPDMTVVLAVEWQRTTASGGWTWPEYVAAAQAVADADTNTTVIDLGARIGSATADDLTLFSDGTHPTNKGHALIASLLSAEIMRAPAKRPVSPHTFIPTVMPPVASANWNAPNSATGTGMYGNWTRDSDGTQGASISYQWVGDAGFYAIGINHRRSTDRGQYDVYIDGELQGSGATFDGYNASLSDSYSSVSNFAVRRSGLHTLQFVMATKNASSTGYKGSLSAITVSRVGDLTT